MLLKNVGSIIKKIDLAFTKTVQKKLPLPEKARKNPAIIFFKIITNLMAPSTVIFMLTILAITVLIMNKFIKEFITISLSVFPVVIGSFLKKIIAKPRPNSQEVKVYIKEKSYNFPSTHAGVAISLFGVLIFLVNFFGFNSIYAYFFCILILLISFSRIILGVHFLSDVIGGLFFGLLTLYGIKYLYLYGPSMLFSETAFWVIFFGSYFAIIIYYQKNKDRIPEFFKKPNKILVRIITGVIIFAITFTAIWIGKFVFEVFMVVIYLYAVYEIIFANQANKKYGLRIIAILFVGIIIWIIIIMRNMEQGRTLTLLFFFTAVISDLSGYFVGNFFGKIKIFEQISPNKTMEGTLAAILIPSIIIGTILAGNINFSYLWALVLSLSAVSGDFLESLFKRKLAIKDFSQILPGHGGILDRIDSNLMTASTLFILITLNALKF